VRYVGSKKRIAKRLLKEIQSRKGDRSVYWEPFCGGLNSFSVVAPHFTRAFASDAHPDLILMWQAIQDGWVPPSVITEEKYQALRNASPSAIRGFAGMGGSFGGKWFGGYARGGFNSDGTPRNHQRESADAALRRILELSGTDVTFRNADYSDGRADSRFVVYCDPPYASTLGYRGTAEFNHSAFWEWCREQSRSGALVLVSEYSAPEDFPCVAEFSHRMSVALSGDRKTTAEKLFVWGGNA
jgi:DNA adenine methylase